MFFGKTCLNVLLAGNVKQWENIAVRVTLNTLLLLANIKT